MKFYQLIEYNMRKISFFLKNQAGNEAGRLVSDLFLIFNELYIMLKQVDTLVLTCFGWPPT